MVVIASKTIGDLKILSSRALTKSTYVFYYIEQVGALPLNFSGVHSSRVAV
jgi:hypothetical protein